MIAYFDTSALIKLVISEDGAEHAKLLWELAGEIFMSRLAWPEATAALAAARRGRRLTDEDYAIASQHLQERCSRALKISVADDLVDQAADLAPEYELRAADAIHLATALAVMESDSIFVTWDRRLQQAAVRAGLVVAPARSLVSEAPQSLDRGATHNAFSRLGDRLTWRGVVADVYVIDGTDLDIMIMAYDAQIATRDIDAIFESPQVVFDEARNVAAELGLPGWWLNEQAKAYVASDGDSSGPRAFDHDGLRVGATSPQLVLAMKALAARQHDVEDIRLLARHLDLTSVEDVLRSCGKVFPDEPVSSWGRLLLEGVFGPPDTGGHP